MRRHQAAEQPHTSGTAVFIAKWTLYVTLIVIIVVFSFGAGRRSVEPEAHGSERLLRVPGVHAAPHPAASSDEVGARHPSPPDAYAARAAPPAVVDRPLVYTDVKTKRKALVSGEIRTLWGYETPFGDDDMRDRMMGGKQISDALLSFNEEAERGLWRQLTGFLDDKRKGYPGSFDEMLPRLDEYVLWAMMRLLKPRRVIEIGSGTSTRVLVHAGIQNARDDPETEPSIVCIEPYRFDSIPSNFPQISVLKQRVQEVDLTAFQELQAGDLLYIDSSHVLKPQGDVFMEYMQILPSLQPGVLVHVHDVFLPYDYPFSWMVDEFRPYTEQWILAAFLHNNPEWEIIWSTHRNWKRHPEWFSAVLPPVSGVQEYDKFASSFWMRKVKRASS